MFKKKYFVMVWEMAFTEFKMRDQGTFLGFLWTLLHPLVYFIVLYSLFAKWMGNAIADFPLYLIIGFVQWSFFATGTAAAVHTVYRYATYIKSINFPKSILIFSSVLSTLFSHLLELAVLLVFVLIIKGTVGWMALGLIPLLAVAVYLIVGIGFILATIGAYFLDIARIWGIFISIGLFLTPIFYSVDMLSPDKQMIIKLNPVTHIIKASRDMLIYNRMPELAGLFYVIGLSTALFVIGYRFFRNNEGYFVERI